MKKLLIVIFVLTITGIGFILFKSSATTTNTTVQTAPLTVSSQSIEITSVPETPISSNSPSSSQSQMKTFNIEGSNFKFSPSEVKVAKGDKIKINFITKEGFHDLVIPDFNQQTPRLSEGKSAYLEFIADKVGTFEFYCSVGNHRQMGMTGKLIVE